MLAKNFRDEHALKGAFLSNLLLRLVDLIASQGDDLLREAEITVPARAVACVLFIGDQDEASLADIAKALDESHQLAAHRVEGLIELGLIERRDDPRDRRRKILSLTPKGRGQYKRLRARLTEIEAAFSGLYEELGIQIPTIIEDAIEALHRTPLLDRIHATRTES